VVGRVAFEVSDRYLLLKCVGRGSYGAVAYVCVGLRCTLCEHWHLQSIRIRCVCVCVFVLTSLTTAVHSNFSSCMFPPNHA
jgi:hypothetical protein